MCLEMVISTSDFILTTPDLSDALYPLTQSYEGRDVDDFHNPMTLYEVEYTSGPNGELQ